MATSFVLSLIGAPEFRHHAHASAAASSSSGGRSSSDDPRGAAAATGRGSAPRNAAAYAPAPSARPAAPRRARRARPPLPRGAQAQRVGKTAIRKAVEAHAGRLGEQESRHCFAVVLTPRPGSLTRKVRLARLPFGVGQSEVRRHGTPGWPRTFRPENTPPRSSRQKPADWPRVRERTRAARYIRPPVQARAS